MVMLHYTPEKEYYQSIGHSCTGILDRLLFSLHYEETKLPRLWQIVAYQKEDEPKINHLKFFTTLLVI